MFTFMAHRVNAFWLFPATTGKARTVDGYRFHIYGIPHDFSNIHDSLVVSLGASTSHLSRRHLCLLRR